MQGPVTFWRVRTAEDDEIIQIVLTEFHALVMEDPLQGVRNGIEDHGGRSEAEGEHGVNVDPVIPFDCLQLPILRVNWHQLMCGLNIYLCQQASKLILNVSLYN